MQRASTNGRFWWRGADGAEALPAAALDPDPELQARPDLADLADLGDDLPDPVERPVTAMPPPRPAIAPSRIAARPQPASLMSADPMPARAASAQRDADAVRLAVPGDMRLPPSRPRPASRPWRRASPPRLMTTLLGASLAGAVLFTGLSGFGRQVRIANPLPQQLDGLMRWAGLGVDEVWLTGHRHTLDSEIFAALDLASAPALPSYDVGAARRRLEALSWVASAHVLRVLPDKLQVRIVERTPVAVWSHLETRALVDASGRVLARLGSGLATDLPVIAGEGAPEAAAELLAALARHPAIAQRVETAIRVGRRRWTLALADGSRIHLPASSSLAALDRLAGLLGANLALNRPNQVIDLRQAGLVAIGPTAARPSPSKPAPRAEALLPHRTVVE